MLYVLLSSLLFSITFFVPALSLFTMTTFLIPLYKRQYTQLFLQGFIWGLIVFGSYWYWIIILFKNQSLYYTGIILWSVATIWCSLFSLLWIYLFNRSPIISTVIFFILVTKVILFPLGNLEGIPCINPLVLLSEYPFMLQPLYYLQDIGMLAIIFGIQNWVAKKNYQIFLLYCIAISAMGLLGLTLEKNKTKQINGAALITPWWYGQKKGAMFEGYRLAHDLCELSCKKDIKIIITPESTFCFDIQEYENFIPLWCESANNIPILLGTHLFLNGFPHNAIVLLHNDKIVYSYFKQHDMPFMERNVWIELFLSKPILSQEFIPCKDKIMLQNDLLCMAGKIYQLFICSEFFFEVKKVWGYPVLFLWNDFWLSCDYMKNLSTLFIRYFEKKYYVDVYYLATNGGKCC